MRRGERGWRLRLRTYVEHAHDLPAAQRWLRETLGQARVGQNGYLLSRRGRSSPANASAFDTHRDSLSSRCAQVEATAEALCVQQLSLPLYQQHAARLGGGGSAAAAAAAAGRTPLPPPALAGRTFRTRAPPSPPGARGGSSGGALEDAGEGGVRPRSVLGGLDALELAGVRNALLRAAGGGQFSTELLLLPLPPPPPPPPPADEALGDGERCAGVPPGRAVHAMSVCQWCVSSGRVVVD
jgi:hypothetical protein